MSIPAFSAAAKHLLERASDWSESRPDPALHMVARVRSAAAALAAFEKLASSPDPTETGARHVVKIEGARKRLGEAHLAEMRALVSDLDRLRGDLQARADRAANLIPTADSAELRAVIRSLPEKDRLAALRDAAHNGDAGLLAALAGKPRLLTGIDPEHLSDMLQVHRARAAPVEFADLGRLESAAEVALVAVGMMSKAVSAAADPARLKMIMNAVDNAADAQAGFNAATAPGGAA